MARWLTPFDLPEILILEDQEEDIVIVTSEPTPEPVRETREATETPEPTTSYSPDTLLLAQNQVAGLAVQVALISLLIGLLLGLEVLKIWMAGSR